MKINTIYLLFLCFLMSLYMPLKCQTLLGKATYKYKFNFPGLGADTLVAELFFNDRGESYYLANNFARLKEESTNYQSENKTKAQPYRIKDSTLVYRNLLTKEYIYNKVAFFRNYLIIDTLKEFQWKILPQFKKIGNFNCGLAKVRYSGRNYEVWYSKDIAVNSGPWKFYGLPGLIIEVKDDSNLVYFALDKIEINSNIKKDFQLSKLKEVAFTKAEFQKKEERDIEKIKGQANSMGVTVTLRTINKGIELEDN